MNNLYKKIFNLTDISYSWLLLGSMFAFIAAFYIGKMNPQMTEAMEWITYGSIVALPTIWGVLNYIDHIRLNARYKRFDNIDVYVDNLIMSKDEKAELKGYLEDYSRDLMSQGKTREEAVKTALSQFAIQEFVSISKNSSIINLAIHYYLVGYTIIALGLALLLQLITSILLVKSYLLLVVKFMFTAYGIGFIGLYFLYKLMDTILSKNISS